MPETLDTVYLDGEFMPLAKARISPLDRAFLFGDAVYESIGVFAGRPMLLDAHIQRLQRSLAALSMPVVHSGPEWLAIVSALIHKNGGGDLAVYLQVSRGADSGRDHLFPDEPRPTVFGMASRLAPPNFARGVAAITLADERWLRCEIKATALLANVLAREAASRAGAVDAILLRDGHVTEAAASSVIVVENETLLRRPNGAEILPGTTTDLVFELAAQAGYECEETLVTEDRLRAADEIWLTSALKGIAPVTRLDGQRVGGGEPGPVWQRLSVLFEACK